MPLPVLVNVMDLDPFPGSPFDPDVVQAASAQVRARAGWHIAPEVTETVTINGFSGGQWLSLPTKRLTDVTAVRRAGVAVTDYTWYSTGLLYRRRGWPAGAYQVAIIHGYPECPLDLVPLVANLAARSTQDTTVAAVGAVSYNYQQLDDQIAADALVLGPYMLSGAIA